MPARTWFAATVVSVLAGGCATKLADMPDHADAAPTGPADSSTAEAATTAVVVIDTATQHQKMDGFGASDAFLRSALSAAEVTAFFDPTNGIGLSLLRIGIDASGAPLGAGAYADAVAAHAFGVRVWAAPWSPPGADKSNGSEIDGGTLNPSSYASWANVLAGFATTFQQTAGFPLYAISAQNEPDFTAPYPSCLYSPSQMTDFVKVLGPQLASLTPPVLLLAPEPDVWDELWGDNGYGTALLGDPAASAAIGILATHDYSHMNDAVPTRPSPPPGLVPPLWETEVSDESGPDVDIAHGIQVAIWIYAAVTSGGVSAWHYWQLVNGDMTDGEGLLEWTGDLTNPPKRLYTVGNFSKFVRPGYVRIDTTGAVPPDVWIVAFENPVDETVAVVAINAGMADVPLTATVAGASLPVQVTPWLTSATDNLAAQAPIAVTTGTFRATLAAETVTTFVGTP